jgi:hypothetical protein
MTGAVHDLQTSSWPGGRTDGDAPDPLCWNRLPAPSIPGIEVDLAMADGLLDRVTQDIYGAGHLLRQSRAYGPDEEVARAVEALDRAVADIRRSGCIGGRSDEPNGSSAARARPAGPHVPGGAACLRGPSRREHAGVPGAVRRPTRALMTTARRRSDADRGMAVLVRLVLDDAWHPVRSAHRLRDEVADPRVLRYMAARISALAERPSPLATRAAATVANALDRGGGPA